MKTLSVKVPGEIHRAVMAMPEERRVKLLRIAAEAIARHGEREGVVKALARFIITFDIKEIDVAVDNYYVNVQVDEQELNKMAVFIHVYKEGRIFSARVYIRDDNVVVDNIEVKEMDAEEALEAVLKAVAWRPGA